MIICIDGNDGTGKTTVIERLKVMLPQHIYQDRGLPSAMTIGMKSEPADLYFILDAPWELCQQRLRNAGKDMTEHWYQEATLKFYRQQFLSLAEHGYWTVIDATQPVEAVVEEIRRKIP